MFDNKNLEICNVIANTVRRYSGRISITKIISTATCGKLSELANSIINNSDTNFSEYEQAIVGNENQIKYLFYVFRFSELLDVSIWLDFVQSNEWAQFCQWKCVELSAVISIDSFTNFARIGMSSWGEVIYGYSTIKLISTFLFSSINREYIVSGSLPVIDATYAQEKSILVISGQN